MHSAIWKKKKKKTNKHISSRQTYHEEIVLQQDIETRKNCSFFCQRVVTLSPSISVVSRTRDSLVLTFKVRRKRICSHDCTVEYVNNDPTSSSSSKGVAKRLYTFKEMFRWLISNLNKSSSSSFPPPESPLNIIMKRPWKLGKCMLKLPPSPSRGFCACILDNGLELCNHVLT